MQGYLRTLGVAELHTSTGVVPLSTREAALLAFICRRPFMRATRTELVALFWPNIATKKARHSLSQLLYALRVRIPDLPLTADAETVTVGGLDLDIVALVKDIGRAQHFSALSRYTGRFLSTDDVASEAFRDWRDQIEEELASVVSGVLQEQSHVCSMADLDRIIQLSEMILSVHPHLTSSQIALIEATVRTGHPEKAEHIYRNVTQADPDQAAALPPVSSFLARGSASPETHSAPFSGREDELKILLDCWEQTVTGEGQVVLVEGEPGIGKTRLADQLLRRVAIRGGGVWIANCCAATQRLPYSVVNELITEHIKPLIPTLNADSAQQAVTSSDEFRHRLTETITNWVIKKAQQQPIAILIDDAQWADEYTALLVAYWAYRLRSEKVMLVLTVRTQEAEPPPEWIHADLGRPVRLRLGRLGVAAAERIVRAFERNNTVALDRSVKDAVLWQSAGRPFLLLEALASLLSDGTAIRPPAAVLSEPAESLLLRRFRNLRRHANRLVGVLAVWGRPIPSAVLHRLAGLREDAFESALNVLHTRGIAHLHEGYVSFPHDLMRETAYRSLLPATKVLIHRRVAAELSAHRGPEGLIAQHYAHAGDSNAAGRHSLRAAQSALDSHSYSAFEYYSRLCIEAGELEQKRAAAVALARHLVEIGRSAELAELVPHFDREDGEHKTLTSISRLEHDLASGNKSVTDLLGYAQSIISEADAAGDPTRASLAATLFDVAFDACAGELDCAALAEKATADTLSPTEPQLHMTSVLSVWHGVTRDVQTGLLMAKTNLERLPSDASPTTRAACKSAYATLLLLSGNIVEARTQFQAALDLASASGDVRRQMSIAINNGVALMEAGEIEAARQSLEKVVTSPNVHFRIRSYTNLAMLHYEDGDRILAGQAAEAVISMNIAYQSPSLGSISYAILGLIALSAKDYDTAALYAAQIEQLPWSTLDDISYTATFLCRMLLVANRQAEAISLLSTVVAQTQYRDVLCAMRLRCELASIMIQENPDVAYRIAKTVQQEASRMGACRLQFRAEQLLSRISHDGSSAQ